MDAIQNGVAWLTQGVRRRPQAGGRSACLSACTRWPLRDSRTRRRWARYTIGAPISRPTAWRCWGWRSNRSKDNRAARACRSAGAQCAAGSRAGLVAGQPRSDARFLRRMRRPKPRRTWRNSSRTNAQGQPPAAQSRAMADESSQRRLLVVFDQANRDGDLRPDAII